MKEARIIVIIAVVMLIASFVFTGMQISSVHKYETECTRIYATVTGLKTEHIHGAHPTHEYRLYYTFTLNGQQHTAKDNNGFRSPALKRAQKLVGKEIEVYVNPHNTSTVTHVSAIWLYSEISICFFCFFAVMYTVGAAIALHKSERPFIKRLQFIWLPMLLISIATIPLLWLGIQGHGLGELFANSSGAIGYTVLTGLILIAALVDFLITRKLNKKQRNQNNEIKNGR